VDFLRPVQHKAHRSAARGSWIRAALRYATKAKMAECHWLKPLFVGQFEFLEWTADNHLRHSRFVGLREDKKAKDVHRE